MTVGEALLVLGGLAIMALLFVCLVFGIGLFLVFRGERSAPGEQSFPLHEDKDRDERQGGSPFIETTDSDAEGFAEPTWISYRPVGFEFTQGMRDPRVILDVRTGKITLRDNAFAHGERALTRLQEVQLRSAIRATERYERS